MERSQTLHLAAPPAWLDHPLFRLALKHVADSLLAGMAWLVADQIWFTAEWSLRRTLLWMLVASTVGSLGQLPRQYYRLVGLYDAVRLGMVTLALVGGATLLKFLAGPLSIPPEIPRIALAASILTGLLWGTLRVGWRSWNETCDHQATPSEGERETPCRPTLVVGAGQAGSLVVQELARHRGLGFQVVGFVDDSPRKRGVRIQGVPVLGCVGELADLIARHNVTHVILAIPSASGQEIRRLNEQLIKLNVQVKTVPGIYNLLGTQVWKPVIRDVSIEDVLRRDPITLDHSALCEAAEGSTVLITGAGGSIGSELARQIARFRPRQIILLGRGENSLWKIQREVERLYPGQAYALELVDIRNQRGLREVFERYRPGIVLHAAAHKHVPFLETHPVEAVLNNILGTLNVVEAARDFGTQVLVNISTDKAVNPTNVLGASKRIAECIVLNASQQVGPERRFVSVRFGNVLGSRGSVVPIFQDQIRRGDPLTVTHPEMTRYFMTVPEASQLVLQAGLLGEGGKVYVLDMGEPVKILDLATDMIRFSGLEPGKDIEIKITGLRPGEKLHEELFLDRERISTRVHSKLFETNPQGIPADELAEGLALFRSAVLLPYEKRQPEIVRILRRMVPTYTPSVLGVGRYGGHVKDRRTVDTTLPPNMKCRRKSREVVAA